MNLRSNCEWLVGILCTSCAVCQAQFTPSFHIPLYSSLSPCCLPAAYKYASANWRHSTDIWGNICAMTAFIWVLVLERKALETWAAQSTVATLSWSLHYTRCNVLLESIVLVLELWIQPLQDIEAFCKYSIASA